MQEFMKVDIQIIEGWIIEVLLCNKLYIINQVTGTKAKVTDYPKY